MIAPKYNVSLPVAAGAVLVGIPYSISLVAQYLYGWPNKPGFMKYVEGLKPRRIYCISRAVLEMLKYLQYSRLYFQWKAWYRNVDNSKHYVKGIIFGRRGKKLDLYHAPSMEEQKVARVVLFVYGGGWGSGERSTYCLLALQMAKELNASVVCPDYCTYPEGNVFNMVEDIADCLLWIREKGHLFNIDKDNIVMIGHSAGAHLCTLTTLFLVDEAEELGIEAAKQTDIHSTIKGIIGLSGVYDILDHYQYEKKRAVEFVSTMHKAMNGVQNFGYYSPSHSIQKLNEEKLKRVPPFGLLHGTNDIIVPESSSVKFSELLTSLSLRATLYLIPNMDHTEVVTDLMTPNRHFYHAIYGCVKQEYNKYMKI